MNKTNYKTKKGWGLCTTIFKNSNVVVDLLDIEPGGFCSNHSHKAKYNIFQVLEGELIIVLSLKNVERKTTLTKISSAYTIIPGVHHYFKTESHIGCKAIEVSFVKIREDDITRFSKSGIKIADAAGEDGE